MTTPDLEPLTRFLLIHTVLLAIGLVASALVHRKYGPTAANVLREDLKLAKDLGINSTPTYLFLDRRKKTVSVLVGAKELATAMGKAARSAAETERATADAPRPEPPLINYAATDKPIADVLRDIFTQAGVQYELSADFDLTEPVTLEVKTGTLENTLQMLGMTARRKFEFIVGADGVYRGRYLPTGIITGKVILPDGKPARKFSVTAFARGEYLADRMFRQYSDSAITDEEGNYRLTKVGAYSYEIQAADFDKKWIAARFPIVEVAADKTVVAPTLKMVRAARVAGKAVRPDGAPIPYLRIWADSPLYSVDGSVIAETDAKGEFRLLALPGKRSIGVEQRAGGNVSGRNYGKGVSLTIGENPPLKFIVPK